jgi:hypothetical protein
VKKHLSLLDGDRHRQTGFRFNGRPSMTASSHLFKRSRAHFWHRHAAWRSPSFLNGLTYRAQKRVDSVICRCHANHLQFVGAKVKVDQPKTVEETRILQSRRNLIYLRHLIRPSSTALGSMRRLFGMRTVLKWNCHYSKTDNR